MKKILIHFDKSKYESEVSSKEDIKENAQHLIDSFIKLEIGEFEHQKFNTLVFNTEQYLFENTMKDVPLKVNGLQLSKKQFYDMVEKPAGYQKLKQAAADFVLFLERRIKYENISFTPQQYLSKYLEFSKAGKLEIAEGIFERIKESHSVYVTTDNGAAIFNLATKLTNFINGEREILKKFPGGTKDQFMMQLSNLFNYPGHLNDDLTINIHAVKLLDR